MIETSRAVHLSAISCPRSTTHPHHPVGILTPPLVASNRYVEILKRPDKAPEAAVATSQDAEPVKFSSTNPFACEDSRTNSPLADEENVMARAALIMKDMQADAAGGAPAAVADPRRASISSGEWSVGPTILPGAKWKRQSEPFEVTIFKAENRGCDALILIVILAVPCSSRASVASRRG